MASSAIEISRADRALQQAAARTAALLRTVPDGSLAVPGLTWNVAETAAHVVAELNDYAGFATGERDARDHLRHHAGASTPSQRNAVANARQLEEFTERDLSRLADLLVPAAEAFIAAAARHSADERIPVTNGLSMTVPMMTTALLGEQLIHGLDIARAARVPWPIARDDALLVIAGVMAMVAEYLDRRRAAGLHLSYELRFRSGPRYRLTIEDGTAALEEPGEKADCWILADPVAFLLVGYGRTGQWARSCMARSSPVGASHGWQPDSDG